jgi:hypothetical protein
MDLNSLVSHIVVSGIGVAAVAWFARSLISQWLARDIERFKATVVSQNTRSLEELRAQLQLEAQRQQIQFGSLHTRRGDLIAELYSRLFDLHGSIQRLLFQYRFREIREEIDRKDPGRRPEPWVIRPGYEALNEDEQKDVDELSRQALDFHQFYGRHRIYFSQTACDLIDRFATLSSFLGMNYHNVAIKDKDGNLWVNPEVKRVWDGAVATIPQLLALLEREFRDLLGVTPVASLASRGAAGISA